MFNSSEVRESVLRTEALVKRFGGLIATDGVSISIYEKELHALIGPNGAGKSTLIGLLSGEISPDKGNIWLNETRITHMPTHQRAMRGIGRAYQVTQIFREFTVIENVAAAVLAHKRWTFEFLTPMLAEQKLVDSAYEALKQVGLHPRADSIAGELAHGEHRQLELAMVLAMKPRLLILDEPLAGMSAAESAQMVELLRTLKDTFPILLVEHDMEAVFTLADRISVLVYGKVIASGGADEIRGNDAVKNAYLGEEGLVA